MHNSYPAVHNSYPGLTGVGASDTCVSKKREKLILASQDTEDCDDHDDHGDYDDPNEHDDEDNHENRWPWMKTDKNKVVVDEHV